jgi:hypothetical protein
VAKGALTEWYVQMKKLIAFALLLVILAGAGYGAYRLGLLSRFVGGGAPGSPSSTETAAGAMQPVAEGGQAAAPAGAAGRATLDWTAG